MLLSEAQPIEEANLYTEYMSIPLRTKHHLLSDGEDITYYQLVDWPFQDMVSYQEYGVVYHCLQNGLSAVAKTRLSFGRKNACYCAYPCVTSIPTNMITLPINRQNKFTSAEQESMSAWLLRASSVHSVSILNSLFI